MPELVGGTVALLGAIIGVLRAWELFSLWANS